MGHAGRPAFACFELGSFCKNGLIALARPRPQLRGGAGDLPNGAVAHQPAGRRRDRIDLMARSRTCPCRRPRRFSENAEHAA
jgi:hypothetical protein